MARARGRLRRVLTPGEARPFANVAEALGPRGGDFPLGAADVGVAERATAWMERLPAGARHQVRLLLRAWEASPLASRHLRSFSRLSPETRAAWVETCAASAAPWRRIPLVLLKMLALAAFTADSRVEAALGYTYDCLEPAPPRRGKRLAPLQHPDVHGAVEETADVCIVGSGAGGAVVAHEPARAARRVVVLEEGPDFTQDAFPAPPND